MTSRTTIDQPVLVTGATGFIGQVLVNKLLLQDIKITVLVLPNETVPQAWNSSDSVTIVRGSITDQKAVKTAMKGIKTVFHLAALVSDWGDAKLFWEVGVNGTRYICNEAVQNETKVILASSIVVYGDKLGKEICTEDTPFGKILGSYGRVKQEQEKIARNFERENNLNVVIIRPANVYGPGSGPWVHQVLLALEKGGPSLINGGDFDAGLVHVSSVADVMVLAAQSEKTAGNVYNVCDLNTITWKKYFTDLACFARCGNPKSIPMLIAKPFAAVVQLLWNILKINTQPPLTRESLNLVGSHHRIPVDKVISDLGYTPDYSYEKAMKGIKVYIEKMKR